MNGERILRVSELVERTGLSMTTLWRRERDGKFPKRRRLGENSVGWLESEVDEWLRDLPTAEDFPTINDQARQGGPGRIGGDHETD